MGQFNTWKKCEHSSEVLIGLKNLKKCFKFGMFSKRVLTNLLKG